MIIILVLVIIMNMDISVTIVAFSHLQHGRVCLVPVLLVQPRGVFPLFLKFRDLFIID